MNISLSSFAIKYLVSRDGFGSQSRLASAYSTLLRLNNPSSIIHLVLTYGIPPDFRGGVHLFI